MKRVIIVCEGQTEKEFCQKILAPYLSAYDILVHAPLIKKSGGGIISWPGLKREIRIHLYDRTAVVTTFIDYYGIKDRHLFPSWEESLKISNNAGKVAALEEGMREDLEDSVRYRYFLQGDPSGRSVE